MALIMGIGQALISPGGISPLSFIHARFAVGSPVFTSFPTGIHILCLRLFSFLATDKAPQVILDENVCSGETELLEPFHLSIKMLVQIVSLFFR